MATSKGFFGIRKGSTKSHTFSEVNGKQVTKDRVYNVKNPKTLLQMQQRLCVAQAGQAYKAFREIVDHSFEGKTSPSANHNYFMKRNIDIVKGLYAEGKGAITDDFIPAPKNFNYYSFYRALLSEGSLSLNVVPDGPVTNITDNAHALVMQLNYIMSSTNLLSENSTVNDFCRLVGVDKGDQLTFVFVVNNTVKDVVTQMFDNDPNDNLNQELKIYNMPSNRVYIARVVIGNNGEQKIFKKYNEVSNVFIFNPDALNQQRSDNYDIIGFDLASTTSVGIINSGNDNADGLIAVCLIRSKYDNGWKRSTSYLSLNQSYVPDSAFFGKYPIGGWGVLSDTAYLNNAIK